jgi:aminopeptidase N
VSGGQTPAVTRHRGLVLGALVAVLAVGAALAVALAHDDGQGAEPRRPPSVTTTAGSATTTTAAPSGEPGASGVGDPYFPDLGNGGYEVDHYDLDLTWAADAGVLAGRATISATATQDLSRFDLDLRGMEVSAVTVDGKPAAVDRADRELVVTPPVTLADGAAFTTVVTYSGRPEPISEGTDLFDVGWQTHGREAFVVSEPSGASTFFPANDHPSDKATYTFAITAPADQVVIANGLLTGQQDEPQGQRRWTYEAADPMATYLVQIAIGDLELIDGGRTASGVVIRHAVHRGLGAGPRALLGRTGAMIDVLDDVYGPFPFGAYGVLVVDQDLGFALETQTLTIVGRDLATGSRNAEIVLLHELSHQWVGDAVSVSTWKDIWLNEGFATYSEWLWSERTGGRSAATSARARARAASAELDIPPGDPGAAELFSRTVYLRGGMTLQALREEIGDDAFFTVLRTWVDRHRYDDASTADFIALAEEVSGRQLDDLFQRWLYGPGLPSLD